VVEYGDVDSYTKKLGLINNIFKKEGDNRACLVLINIINVTMKESLKTFSSGCEPYKIQKLFEFIDEEISILSKINLSKAIKQYLDTALFLYTNNKNNEKQNQDLIIKFLQNAGKLVDLILLENSAENIGIMKFFIASLEKISQNILYKEIIIDLINSIYSKIIQIDNIKTKIELLNSLTFVYKNCDLPKIKEILQKSLAISEKNPEFYVKIFEIYLYHFFNKNTDKLVFFNIKIIIKIVYRR